MEKSENSIINNNDMYNTPETRKMLNRELAFVLIAIRKKNHEVVKKYLDDAVINFSIFSVRQKLIVMNILFDYVNMSGNIDYLSRNIFRLFNRELYLMQEYVMWSKEYIAKLFLTAAIQFISFSSEKFPLINIVEKVRAKFKYTYSDIKRFKKISYLEYFIRN